MGANADLDDLRRLERDETSEWEGNGELSEWDRVETSKWEPGDT